jgi:long-chain fatty acid adenylase/transferase FadD26
MLMRAISIPAALGEHVRLQPDAPAFTFIDYEVDPGGFTETLTWA